jgi:hypothetical protein
MHGDNILGLCAETHLKEFPQESMVFSQATHGMHPHKFWEGGEIHFHLFGLW